MFKAQAIKLQKKLQLEKLAELLGEQFGLDPDQLLEIAGAATEILSKRRNHVDMPEITEVIWNTGRYYGEYKGVGGQIIHAKVIGTTPAAEDSKAVHFHDKTRGISGIVSVWEFTEADILEAYDCGGYEFAGDLTLEEQVDETI